MAMTLPAPESSSSSRFYAGLAAGAAIMLFLVGAVVLYTRGSGRTAPDPTAAHLPFGAAEQAYAAQIRFSGLELSQATNLANQEFTYVVGTVANTGSRTVRVIEVTVEFQDLIHQLVLRETARVFPPGGQPLAPGQQRSFQLTFERVPASWNHQPPVIRVTGLDLQ
jgi:hypothetical protein